MKRFLNIQRYYIETWKSFVEVHKEYNKEEKHLYAYYFFWFIYACIKAKSTGIPGFIISYFEFWGMIIILLSIISFQKEYPKIFLFLGKLLQSLFYTSVIIIFFVILYNLII